MTFYQSVRAKFDRFDPTPIFRAHKYGLSDYRRDSTRPDKVARLLLWVGPLGVGLAVFGLHGTLAQPAALLSGLALLSGALLAAFGQLSTLRIKAAELTSEQESDGLIFIDHFDETAAHLLVAAYVAALTAGTLVLGINFGLDTQGRLWGFWAALAAGLSSYVFLLFLVALPRLYIAYAGINKIRDEMNGTFAKKRQR